MMSYMIERNVLEKIFHKTFLQKLVAAVDFYALQDAECRCRMF